MQERWEEKDHRENIETWKKPGEAAYLGAGETEKYLQLVSTKFRKKPCELEKLFNWKNPYRKKVPGTQRYWEIEEEE